MRKMSIRSVFLVSILVSHSAMTLAASEIVHEIEPIHLGGCSLNTPPGFGPTTLGYDQQSSAVYQGSVMRTSLSGGLIKKAQPGGTSTIWNAATLLEQRTEARRIFTSNQHGNLVPFAWGRLDEVQRGMLDRSPITQANDGFGERRLHYLLGDRVDEQGHASGVFPRRDSVLGAIVQSTAVRVGVPMHGRQSPAYQAFQQMYRDRRAVVYVGAADGMLHAFDDASGKELFAYVPHALFEKLPSLTVGPRFGVVAVDGGIATADVLAKSQWRTVLAFGIGRGAQGVAALDVSDPEGFGSVDHLLWEFTDRDDPDIGDVIGSPVIARFRTGIANGIRQYGYFVMVTSGLNTARNDGEGSRSTSGTNTLFLLSLDKRPTDAWQSGVNYFKFSTPAGNSQLPNGMTEVVTVAGADDAVERAYAGDLQGNLWRFDFSAGLPFGKSKGTTPDLLFVAQDAVANRQPITHKPAVVFASGGGYVVLFGTGQYLSRADLDPSGFSTQSFYAVLDRGNASQVQRNELVQRQLLPKNAGSTFEMTGDVFTYGVSGNARKGWYFDFPESASSGERVVSPLSLVGSQLVFNSLLPSAKPCEVPTAKVYALDTLSGLPTNTHFSNVQMSSGMPGSFVITASNRRDSIGTTAVGKRQAGPTVEIVQGNSSTIQLDLPINASSVAGRLSWRELVNWSELRHTGKGMSQP